MKAMARQPRHAMRSGERIPFHAPLQVATLCGRRVAPLARCTNLGLGGLRVAAAEGVEPGTRVDIELRLPSGRWLRLRGRVVWLRTTLHPVLLGTPTGRDDDACFGVAFEQTSAEERLPIARLLIAWEAEKRRARRIRRLHVRRIHA